MRSPVAPSFLLLPIVSLLALSPAREAAALTTTCVNGVALLQSALTTAQSNGDDNLIELVTGSYGLVAPYSIAIPAGHSLTIEGGYAAGCGAAPDAEPYFTTIGGASGVSLRIAVADGNLTLRNVSLSGFAPPAGTNPVALVQNGAGGTLHVENLYVTGDTVAGIGDDILYVSSQGGLTFDDNIVAGNPNANSAVHIAGNEPALPFVVANNTIVKNTGPGLFFDVSSFLPSGLYNNILWSNGLNDLVVGSVIGATPPLALNNIWIHCSGCGSLDASSANNSAVDPVLTANYRPANGSPTTNAGVPLPLVLPATDAANAPRVVGSAPDQGAFESIVDDFAGHTYVVYKSNDDAADIATLRGAITDANSKGVPARINLHYSSGCPTEVDLATSLPPIAVSMLIDGYADPNSAVNTAAKNGVLIPFNATLCTTLFNTGPSTNTAFATAVSATASLHLEVRGVRISHFDTAVVLGGGNGNWVHGNAFSLFGTLGNDIGVSIAGGQADVVGGLALGDVNLIGASSGLAGTGVVVQGADGFHTIINNNIGGSPAGDTSSTAYANAQNGVELVDASRDTVTANNIDFSGASGLFLNHSSWSVVTGNTILLGGDVGGSLTGTVPGVRLSNNASNNWIGSTGESGNFADAVPNLIYANSGPGVWLDTTAGYNNQVVGNDIALNLGLSIDLGAQGPTANSGTEGAGPNFLIHKPVLAAALDTGSDSVQVSGTLPMELPFTGRFLTLYANQNCGDAQSLLGTFFVMSGADSIAHFSTSVPKPTAPALVYVTAVDEADGNGPTLTSEISNTRMIKPHDDIFYDQFDCY